MLSGLNGGVEGECECVRMCVHVGCVVSCVCVMSKEVSLGVKAKVVWRASRC